MLMKAVPRAETNWQVAIFSTAATLCAFLIMIRAHVLGFDWKALLSSLVIVPKILMAMHYDFLFVVVLTSAFLGLLQLFRNNITVQQIVSFSYFFAAFLILIQSLINIKVVQVLGSPFNYQWLYYSDFLKSLDARLAIQAVVSWKLVMIAMAGVTGMILIACFLNQAIKFALAKYISWRGLLICTIMLYLVYVPFANWYLNNKSKWDYAKLENPTFSFLHSIIPSDNPRLFTMKTDVGYEDFQVVAERPAVPVSNRTDSGIRNVLIFVLESVPSEYIEAYGGRYPVTPELNKYRRQSLLFKNIYAHAPATNKSLVSILTSVYPWISYNSLTQEYPNADLSSLSGELKKHEYRTAFFYSADIRFQGADKFLDNRGFDIIQDYRTRPCDRPTIINSTDDWPFLDGSDDECTAKAFLEWLSTDPGQPFFAMLWTMMTHYPYFASRQEIDFGVKDEFFNRYLNALYHSDRILGNILGTLEKIGLAESTLVVVVGDHGEAFGRHSQFTHASKVYEENVHIPLIFINPKLFKGEEHFAVGGLIDLDPTIMDLLNLPSPGNWQGRSLFSDNRSNRVYFFAPWSGFIFGFREDNRKFIFNAHRNTYEIYDLLKDPLETANLSEQFPDAATMIQQRLAAWVQYQNGIINNSISSNHVLAVSHR